MPERQLLNFTLAASGAVTIKRHHDHLFGLAGAQ